MRELFSSEPNLVKITTSVQGRPENPVGKPLAVIAVGNDKDALIKESPTHLTVNQLDNGEYEIPIPHHYLSDNRYGLLVVEYELEEFGVIRDEKYFSIVRRLMSFDELNGELGEQFAVDYDTFSAIEKRVRMIIQDYTQQSFNSWFGRQTVRGVEGQILLPDNLESLSAVWVGSSLAPGFTNKVEGYLITDGGQSIYNPSRQETVNFFHSKSNAVDYIIEGSWGYKSVPESVHQAALELARGFLCDDIEYRRKFIDNIRFGDTRIEFAEGAYQDSTGNPIADAMLQPFRRFLIGAV